MLIFKKEKKVAALAHDFADAVWQCAKLAEKVVDEYLDGQVAKADREDMLARQEEHTADSLLAAIREALFDGAFLPTIREDVFRLMQTVDQVANACHEVSKHFADQCPDVPPEMNSLFLRASQTSFASVKSLRKALQCYFDPKGKTEKVREHICEAGERESAADDIERQLTRAIFATDLELARKQHLRRTLHKIVRVSDRAEDACDELELTVLKSIA